MEAYNLLIVYNDGTEHVVKRVNSHSYDAEIGCFKYAKNNYYSFLPYGSVRFFGREFDYKES